MPDVLCGFQGGDDMKRLLLGMMAMMMLVMSGCGDASVAVYIPLEPLASPPSITTYRFTKDPVTEFIDGSVDFYAPDSDIDTITVVVFDPRGFEISRSVRVFDFRGAVWGTIPFSIDYVTFPSTALAYTFSIYLTDFNGNTSNQAVDLFRVP